MPRLILHMDRLDSLVVAAFQLVVTEGVSGPSLRSVARAAGTSPASVISHFGSADELWGRLAHRWKDDRGSRLWGFVSSGARRYLAETSLEVLDQAFDFALMEVGRGHIGVARAMADLRRTERDHLASGHRDLDEADLDVLVAVIEGLRFAMSVPDDAVPISRAHAALERFLTRFVP